MADSRKARDLSEAGMNARTRQRQAEQEAHREKHPRGQNPLLQRLQELKARPFFDYFLLLFVVLALTGIGLVMVLSASMATAGSSGNVFSVFARQLIMVLAGLAAMWITLVVSVETIRRAATPALIGSIFLLILVLIPGVGIGAEETGAQSWLIIAGVTMQPSELAKIALAVWGAKLLADRVRTATSWKELFLRFAVVSAFVLALVVLQGDLGMSASMAFVVFALALFAGLPRNVIVLLMASAGVIGAILVATQGFRSARIRVYLDALMGNFSDIQNSAYQSYQGFLSLADGSFTGVGLGQSVAKWGYLPEAKNDFIFAIIGEELGFVGALGVIVLYTLLGVIGLRIASRQHDPFLRLLAGTITAATVVQAFINIGYVVGALPVTGLQLPLISSGGTSAVVTLLSTGLLATCARHEAEAVSAMQNSGRPAIDRWLRLPEPLPFDESKRYGPKVRRHRDPQRFGPPVQTSGARTRAQRTSDTAERWDSARPVAVRSRSTTGERTEYRSGATARTGFPPARRSGRNGTVNKGSAGSAQRPSRGRRPGSGANQSGPAMGRRRER